MTMQIGDTFERDVRRPIPPVVYFHEQGAAELQREVEEYIITGGFIAPDPRATPDGIHEQFVRLLGNMRKDLDTEGGPRFPACWISGFYGSGKSSFAKLLGLALDGRTLPNGKTLADALLARDRSPNANEFASAWELLTGGLKSVAVVFDVGAQARDAEHIHAVAVRQVQKRLDYCSTSSLVAEYEMKLEVEEEYEALVEKVLALHGRPWNELKHSQLAEDYFSAALHALRPALFPDAMAWVNARSGSAFDSKRAADDAVLAIQRMMDKRRPKHTLFLVIDEVSQYVHEDDERMLALQSFVAALGQRLRGKGWILATGQQKLEESAGVAGTITKLKGRFPQQLRVHLGNANIREVVHQRLLRKNKTVERDLADLFHKHRTDLSLYAYQGDQIAETEFVEIYPLLPGHIDLLLRITTGLRSRSTRVQGDAHEIRGLLQLLGDIFREQDLVRREWGWLLTLDRVYDVLHTALEVDIHMTLNRAMDFCQAQNSELMKRVLKAVAMLELVQDEKHPTTADLVSRSLYARLGDANPLPEIQKALDVLVGEGFLGLSGQTGYKIESSAGQEWQQERDRYDPTAAQRSEQVQKVLREVVSELDRVSVEGLPLAWHVLYSDNADAKDVRLRDERKPTAITVDFQFTKGEGPEEWIPRSSTSTYKDRVVWVVGEQDDVRHVAAKLVRSFRMVDRYAGKQLSDVDKQRLLSHERNDADTTQRELVEAVKAAFLSGKIYFAGQSTDPRQEGSTFVTALVGFAERAARRLYPNPIAYTVTEKDILYLIESTDLSAPPPVLGEDKLGILALDAGRYEITCKGRVPQDVLKLVKDEGAVTGGAVIAKLGGPPHGVPPDVTRAAVVGLLRGGKIRVEIASGQEMTSVRDEGARELLKDGGLRKARITENTSETLSPRDRNAICSLFKEQLGRDVAREPDAIADAVAKYFPEVRKRLTRLGECFRLLPRATQYPAALAKLEDLLESCRRDRRVEPTTMAVKRALPALRDGLTLLRRMESELTEESARAVQTAADVDQYESPGLLAIGPTDETRAAASALATHLKSERPWEGAAELSTNAEKVRAEYRERRRAVLTRHEVEVAAAIESVKRRDGFDKLAAEGRHKVLQHLREGAAAQTDERAIAPPLDVLEGQLATRRQAAEHKALQQLDALRESSGERPVVEVTLGLAGRELETEAELDRLLADLRARILHELVAKHRVRLKGS